MPDDENSATIPVMIIGNNNVFEVDCIVECKKVGDNNIVESKAHVGRSTVLSSGCVIGAKCQINVGEVLPEGTLFYGLGSEVQRRIQSDKPSVNTLIHYIFLILPDCSLYFQTQAAQIEFLSKVLPNYHRIRKPAV